MLKLYYDNDDINGNDDDDDDDVTVVIIIITWPSLLAGCSLLPLDGACCCLWLKNLE